MTTACDYAEIYEREFHPRRRLRRALARLVWAGLLIVAPYLAMRIWRERDAA